MLRMLVLVARLEDCKVSITEHCYLLSTSLKSLLFKWHSDDGELKKLLDWVVTQWVLIRNK